MYEYTTLSVTPEVAEEIRERRDNSDRSTSEVMQELLSDEGE